MADTALSSLYKAVRAKLNGVGNASTRVYPDMGDDEATETFWVYFYAAGGEANQRRRGDANITIGVKCVSRSLSASFVGASEISTALNNKGVQDIVVSTGAYVTSPLDGGANWLIKTSTQEEAFHFTELIKETSETVYHDGAYYRFIMEAK